MTRAELIHKQPEGAFLRHLRWLPIQRRHIPHVAAEVACKTQRILFRHLNPIPIRRTNPPYGRHIYRPIPCPVPTLGAGVIWFVHILSFLQSGRQQPFSFTPPSHLGATPPPYGRGERVSPIQLTPLKYFIFYKLLKIKVGATRGATAPIWHRFAQFRYGIRNSVNPNHPPPCPPQPNPHSLASRKTSIHPYRSRNRGSTAACGE